MKLAELVAYLDEYLRVSEVPDYPGALNGLQVENSGSVTRVAVAVDAAQATIDLAVESGADLLIVHHGLFWDGNQPVVGRRYRRLRSLVAADMAVYSSHLPLDVHAEVGNNAVLARLIGVERDSTFGEYGGYPLGVAGVLEIDRDELRDRLRELLGSPVTLVPGGAERVHRVGVITGGAGDMVSAARAAGLDAFVTGEGAHHNYFDAEEGGVNLYFGGHYATEVWGVRALAEHIGSRFGLDWTFLEHPTGL
jgi:dinuclear metal center YbgI/SA1388 family protein